MAPSDPTPAEPVARRVVRAAAALAALAAFSVGSYAESLGWFFHLDDFWVLKAGAAVRSLADLPLVFRPTHGFFFYRPVSTTGYFAALHALFGPDPARFHAVHLGFHVANAFLAYALAARLFGSRVLGFASALVYAAAPGHVLAVYWIALFTVTGTAFFYYLTLWAWVALSAPWRVPLTFVGFLVAMLSSEHAVSLPLALAAATWLLPDGDRRRALRSLVPVFGVLAAYLVGKGYAVGHLMGATPPADARQAFAWLHYHMSFAPLSVLELIGRYLAFGVAPLYAPDRSAAAAVTLGIGVMLVSGGVVAAVASGRCTARPARVAAFGLVVFLLGLGPVVVLPAHVYSCYVGLAMLGLALALVGLAASVPRVPAVAVAGVVAATVLVAHARVTLPVVRRSAELRYVESFSGRAARWLYALASLPDVDGLREVVVPEDQVTVMMFHEGEAQRVFLCAPYQVRTTVTIDRERPEAGRAVVRAPAVSLPPTCADYACLRRVCGGR